MSETNTTAASNIKMKIIQSVEVPQLRRCCFCIPLRRGIITMAYINLILALLTLPTFLYLVLTEEGVQAISQMEGSSQLWIQVLVQFVTLVIEILATVVVIIALHMKHAPLLRMYLYYGVGYLILMVVTNLVMMSSHFEGIHELMLLVALMVVHSYFLVLIWSATVKITRDGSIKYVVSMDEV